MGCGVRAAEKQASKLAWGWFLKLPKPSEFAGAVHVKAGAGHKLRRCDEVLGPVQSPLVGA